VRFKNFRTANADTAAVAIRFSFASLGPRLLTAAVLAAGAIAAVQIGGTAFFVVVSILSAIVTFEWMKMSCRGRAPRASLLAVLVVGVSSAIFGLWGAELALLAGALGAVLVGIAARAERSSLIWASAGVFVFILSMTATIWLRAEESTGIATIYWLFAVVWATDSGAYLFGSLIGGAALAPRISPAKTWSGAIGGLLTGALSGVAVMLILQSAGVLGTSVNLTIIAAASAVLALFSQAGDLAESAAKRYFGVKDSGTWLPGHGGALDRLDSLVLVAPFLALAILLAGGSAQLLTWVGN
jgi:phosphatidate cytidylyltransferase